MYYRYLDVYSLLMERFLHICSSFWIFCHAGFFACWHWTMNILFSVWCICRMRVVLKIISFLNRNRQKFQPIIKEYKYFLPKQLSLVLQNMGWGSEIQDPDKTYPRSRGRKGTRSRIRNTTVHITDLVLWAYSIAGSWSTHFTVHIL